MPEDTNIVSKNKMNKKLLIGTVVFIVLALVAVLAVFAPKVANAKKVAEKLSLGEKYLSELNYEQAEVAYLAVIEIDPKNVDAYIGLVDTYVAQSEYDKALEVLEDALEELDGDAEEAVSEKLAKVYDAKAAAEVTPTPPPTPTPMPTATSTPTPVPTPTPTLTSTPEPTATSIPTPEPTVTNTPTPEPTATSTPTPEPTATSTPTPEPTATNTPTPEPTATSTPTPEPTATNTPTPKPTSTPTPSPSPEPKETLVEILVQDAEGKSLEDAEVILTNEAGVLHKAVYIGSSTYIITLQEGYYDLDISCHGYKSIETAFWANGAVVSLEWELENEAMSQDYGEIAGHRYQFIEAGVLEWDEAEQLCRLLGGYLAVISSEIENDFLYQMMRNNGYYNAYFGYSDTEEEGNWRWLSGESTYENWADGEPNDDCGGEDYAMFYYMFEDGKWNDGNFGHGTLNDDKVFICEWDTLE